MASFSSPVINPLSSQTFSEKLTKSNHALWKMQVLTIVRGVGLKGYLIKDKPPLVKIVRVKNSDGKEEVPNSEFWLWSTTDQQVLGFLLSSMTKYVLAQVTPCRTTSETWQVIEVNFTLAKRARTINSRIALATTKKGELSVEEYVNKMRFLGDELAAAGKPIDNDKLISYIFADLDFEYNSVVITLLAKEVLTVDDIYSHLINFKQHLPLKVLLSTTPWL
jgi:hypothetical protein